MLKSIKNVEIVNKKVLLRLDLNVPIHDKKIQSDFRIKKSVPTILYLLSKNNKVIILSHLGRPEEGKSTPDLSLKKISEHFYRKNGTKNKYRKICTRSRMHIKTGMNENRCEKQLHYF